MEDAALTEQEIADNDSLYRMPLRVVPIETTPLRRSVLIKNTSLIPALEMFRNQESGSGQVLLHDLSQEKGHHMFGWPEDGKHPDMKILEALGRLEAYDIYSLRIQFRELGIELTSVDYLKLSPEKQESLRSYMQIFTLPLIESIYGDAENTVKKSLDVVDLFRNPDTGAAKRNLFKLADKLQVDVMEIPRFLDDFSDVYLSLAYFKEYVDDLTPKFLQMVEELKELESNWELSRDPNFLKVSRQVQSDLNDLITSVTSRFEAFRQKTDYMWHEISADKYRDVKELVGDAQRTVSGVLCGLGVKLNAWNERFPKKDVGGPVARNEMLFADILPGLDKLVKMEQQARAISLAA